MWLFALLLIRITVMGRIFRKKVIGRFGEEPYLIRYSIFSCPLFAIKIHNILRSDDDCLHDHPWAFITILLKGAYIEESEHYNGRRFRYYSAGTILYRHKHWIHRLIIDKPVRSLVITFKKKRGGAWGFFTPKGWVFWKDYKPTGGCE